MSVAGHAAQAKATPADRAPTDATRPREDEAPRAAWALLLGLLVLRAAYHALYLGLSPFARAPFSDGQVYVAAARDLLAHPPLGSAPFYLQGLYAAFLAPALGAFDSLRLALAMQVALAFAAGVAFFRAATEAWGARAGLYAALAVLLFPGLAFYENKLLSASLGVSFNTLALAWFVRAASRSSASQRVGGAWLLAGVGAGLAVLARPNMVLAVPFFVAGAAWLAARASSSSRPASPRAARGRHAARASAWVTAGVLLALAPMAARNAVVTGRATVLPSHGGAIPLYMGNHRTTTGRWNTIEGLVSGQVGRERREIAEKLGLTHLPPAEQDRAIDRELSGRLRAFITAHPGEWLGILLKKLWLTTGNHRLIADYDVLGEAELVGPWHLLGLPFAFALGLAALGLGALARDRAALARAAPLLVVVGGQFLAILAANVLVFTSSQNREPLIVPLCFLAAPGLVPLAELVGRVLTRRAAVGPSVRAAFGVAAPALAVLVTAQGFLPRAPRPTRPSAVHYFNLASVEEVLGEPGDALAHFEKAAAQAPERPMFALRYARALRLAGERERALAELGRLSRLREVPPVIQAAAREEARLLSPRGPRAR